MIASEQAIAAADVCRYSANNLFTFMKDDPRYQVAWNAWANISDLDRSLFHAYDEKTAIIRSIEYLRVALYCVERVNSMTDEKEISNQVQELEQKIHSLGAKLAEIRGKA